MSKKIKEKQCPALDAAGAASKLYTCLSVNKKLVGSAMAEMPRAKAVKVCETALLKFRELLRGSRGGRLRFGIIAIAVARLAGCGTSTAAVARAIDATVERHGDEVTLVQNRIVASSHLWQERPDWDSGVVDETEPDDYDEPLTEEPAGEETCTPCSDHVCSHCRQPPASKASYWRGFSSVDLNSAPTCKQCRMPRIPASLIEAAEMANEEKGDMPDHFDPHPTTKAPRIAPRPHEHAFFSQNKAASAIGKMLMEGQPALPWDKIVALADDPVTHKVGEPLKVACTCCGVRRNFDFVFGCIGRMQHEEQQAHQAKQSSREADFLDSPAICNFNETVVPAALNAIAMRRSTKRRAGKLSDIEWTCTNCEADIAMRTAREQHSERARNTAEALGLGPAAPKIGAPRALGCAVTIPGNELASLLPQDQKPDELDLPAKLSFGVQLVEREPLALILDANQAIYRDLVGEPDTEGLFASGTSIGRLAETRDAAGGDDVNSAAVVVAPKKTIDALLQQGKDARATSFWELLRTPHNGFEAVGFALLDMELPDAEEVAAEQKHFFSKRKERSRGHADDQMDSKSEVRVGKVSSWAALLRNPDFVDCSRMLGVTGGRAHIEHMLMVVKPNGDLSRALLIYPSGPRGKASKTLKPEARRLDGAQPNKKKQKTNKAAEEEEIQRKRLCYGQPRTFVIVPGRPFFDATLVENQQLQSQSGPFGQRARKLAHCGLVSMLALAFMGLAPRPGEDKDEWCRNRQPLILGDGIAHTAAYTWACLGLHSSPDLAIHALACVQGFCMPPRKLKPMTIRSVDLLLMLAPQPETDENFYAATLHWDKDRHWETWTLQRSEAAAARSGGATPSPTHVPQLRINFECDENRTIWTAGFQRLLHGALVRGGGPAPRPEGWVPNRGVGESFYIQARGSKSYGGVSHWIWHAEKPPEPAPITGASRRHGGAGSMP